MTLQANQEPTATTPPQELPVAETEVIDRAAYEQVKADMHRFKEQARQKDDQLKSIETEKLKNEQKWKELAEIKEREANEANDKFNRLNSAVVTDRKMAVIRAEAIKLGLLPSAIDDLESMNWSDVTVEATSTGRVNVIGAAKAVERFKTLKPHWFRGLEAPGVNTNTPGVVPGAAAGQVTLKDVQAAEAEAKKTGDYSKYKETLLRFRAQQ